ncbi:MAG: major outer membrane protein [Arcobacteraceae bacterium]|nr:major outer membrane protein [Arcobacteraceae bacterium]
MKNTIKMSLVAALAVAGLSTTASAGGLEEAIKGVSISGKMEVEYDYSKTNTGIANAEDVNGDSWDLDWDVTAKIPVNDNVTAIFGLEGDTATDTKSAQITGKGNVQATKVYFQYANGPVTAMVGKQGIGAPWFDDERANGVKALVAAGPVTLAAAHFTGANADADANSNNALGASSVGLEATQISAVAAIASVGPVNLQVWYAQLAGITALTTTTPNNQLNADSIIVMADAKFDIVNVGFKYGTADYNMDNAGAGYNALDDDAEMIQLIVSADLGVATPYIGMGMTDSKQGGAGLDLTNDTDSVIDFGSEQLSIDDLDNAEAFIIGVTVPVGKLTLDASYVMGDYDSYIAGDTAKATAYNADLNEFLIQADYKMSKNFNIGAHYSIAELEYQNTATSKVTQKMDAASVSLEYKF